MMPLESTFFLSSPALLISGRDAEEDRTRLSEFFRAHQPCLNSSLEVAIDEARMAGPSAEDPDELARYLGIATGTRPADWAHLIEADPPAWDGYVLKIAFSADLSITPVETTDKASHLSFRRENPDVDALWLPDGYDDPPNNRLRIVTHRDLSPCFELVESLQISGRFRPPRQT